jgi:hypothetical protein
VKLAAGSVRLGTGWLSEALIGELSTVELALEGSNTDWLMEELNAKLDPT